MQLSICIIFFFDLCSDTQKPLIIRVCLQEVDNYNFISRMIPEEVQDVFVERTLIVKQENIARRNYKIRDWLKLVSLLEEDKDYARIDSIIKDEIHQNFILIEGFWVSFVKRKFEQTNFDRNSVEIAMLALDDGAYFDVARIIQEKILTELTNKKLGATFCLSILQKMVSIFQYDSKMGAHLFKGLRAVYEHINNPVKVRETFERELRKGYDDFDITYDEYTYWQKEEANKKKNESFYQLAKAKWQQNAIQFDKHLLSEVNIKRSLFILENQNKSKIDEDKYISWLQKLPTQKEKLWFLRRVALNCKQMIEYYLIKIESYYSNDEDEIIKKFKVAIRLAENTGDIQRKYLCFLIRRISLHLTKEVEQQYYDGWGEKVTFFRNQINQFIKKDRKLMTKEIQQNISIDYYKLWIQIEEKIIKDKDAICRLYQLIIKDTNDFLLYENYSESLINLQALKQAKNVLKRYLIHAQNQRSKQRYKKYLSFYGTIDDQISYLKEEQLQKKEQIRQLSIKPQKQSGAFIQVHQNQTNCALSSTTPQTTVQADKDIAPNIKRPRDTYNDDMEQKIQDKMRKKLHLDGQYTVYVKGIPIDWKESDVIKILRLPDKVVRISLIVKNNEQRDYCYIQYDSKETAQAEVSTNNSGYSFKISKPPSEYDQSKTIFVCALPTSATEQKIRNMFGNHSLNIQEVRLKLQKDKNYAYVDFNSKQQKDAAFEQFHSKSLLIDSKKILIQHCDSNRMRNKKFIQVVFLKNLSFKAEEKDIISYFEGKNITKISIPKSESNDKKGFAYVQFEKFKDYQEVLDMKKGSLFGRQFLIFKSDRAISQPRVFPNEKPNPHNPNVSPKKPSQQKQKNKQFRNKHTKQKKQQATKQGDTRDNNFFSNLFK